MIKGGKPVPDGTSVGSTVAAKDIVLVSGNVVNAGDDFLFVPQEIEGTMEVTLYNSSGSVMYHGVSESEAAVSTAGYLPGVYFYMASDAEGYRKTGKLLVK
jgi:hypothetical protein